MSRSSFLSIISVVALASGCSDPDCGPHGAPADLAITGANVALSYGGLFGSPNNDCPDPTAPKGVVSLTVCGELTTAPGGCTGAGGGVLTLCISRPDKLGTPLALGSDVQVIDVSGSDASCSYIADLTVTPSGTAKGAHVCGNGSDKAGFALTIDGQLALQRTCGATVDSVPVTIAGTVAVAGPP